MPFDGLVQIRTTKKQNVKLGPRGCAACPLNAVEGIQKIMGSVDVDKNILIVGQSPGPEENEQGTEFVGKSGKWLWDELKKVGIRRSHCSVFNTVRCFPADRTEGTYNSYLKMREPSPQEIHCCGIHTEEAMQTAHPKHILVLGKVAQKAFLETRSVPKTTIFWSDKYQARIYLADHPSFFIRGYGAGARIEAFRKTLSELANNVFRSGPDEGSPDNFAYLRRQKYYLISTADKAAWAGRIIKKYAKKGRRISVDIEYDDLYPGLVIFAIGFCPKPGMSFTYVFDYPGKPDQFEKDAKACWGWAKVLLENAAIKKVFHYGCSDVTALKTAHVEVQGFDWDTNYSEYLYYPDEHNKYGLSNIAERRFQEFSGYKSIILDDLFAALPPDLKVPSAVMNGSSDAKIDWLKAHDGFHLSRLKPKTLRLYNGADCDLTKRIEIDNKKKVPHALVRLYIDLSFILLAMESNGPWFDYWQHKHVSRLWPYLEKKALKKLRKMIKDPEFNPASPQQVFDAVYNRLGLEYPLHKGKPNTQKKTMLMLAREHPFPGAVVDWRKLSKAMSTYIDGPLECAKRFLGRVKSVWWGTGTATGRLSSSGGDEGGMNLQNLHKDPRLLNLYCADTRWREVFKAIRDILKHQPEGDWEECIEGWVRTKMPDLKTFLMLDYGQLEIRVLAQMCGDKNLKKDCESGDIHTAVGVTMTGWSADAIKNDDKTRTLTKNVHFGIVYLIAKKNLFDFIKAMNPDYNGTQEDIDAQVDRYFARYTGVADYLEEQQQFAQDNGYVETLFGLHRALNVTDYRGAFEGDAEYVDESSERQTSWRSQSVNTGVQGTGHQLLVCGIVNLVRKPEEYKLLMPPCLDVHDAMYFMVPVLQLREAYRKARKLMEKDSLETVKKDFPHIKWDVPMIVEAKAGLRLGTRVKLKDDKFTVGSFLLAWYHETKKQMIELHKELKEVPDVA